MIHHPSPNAGPRRDGLRPELVVLHFTEMASAEAALARLCDPSAEVSADDRPSRLSDVRRLHVPVDKQPLLNSQEFRQHDTQSC